MRLHGKRVAQHLALLLLVALYYKQASSQNTPSADYFLHGYDDIAVMTVLKQPKC